MAQAGEMIMEPESHPDSLLAPENLPYLISGLYLLGFFTGISALVGFIFCFVLANNRTPEWVVTHLRYHKRTFIIGLVLGLANFILFGLQIVTGAIRASASNDISATLHIFGGFGVFLLIGLIWMAWMIARCVLSIIKTGDRAPMPNPESWLW
jgi:uncharacterized membrane protein